MASLNRSHWYAVAATLAAIILTLSAVNASRSFRAQTLPGEPATEGETGTPEETVPEDALTEGENVGTVEESSSPTDGDGTETDSPVTLFFRPHCEQEDQTSCPEFSVRDPLTLETERLRTGDVLDLDIVVRNDLLIALSRVRAWLLYDPVILEGINVKAGASLPTPAPGEEDFDAEKGYVMIDVEAEAEEGVEEELIPVAQVTFRVKDIPAGGETVLSFYDPEGEPPHTAVYDAGEGATNVLGEELGSLAVPMENAAAASQESSSSSVPETPTDEEPVEETMRSPEEEHPVAEEPVVQPVVDFSQLQVQNIRVTTEGSTLYVAWDALPSAKLRGFHVYYGTQTGQYIQRRTVRPDETGIAIRSLPPGITYYAAVRGFNGENGETAFSQEAAVVIGDPTTSTAPLRSLAGLGGNPLQGQATAVPGDSGLGTTMTLLLVVSAVIGTLFAFRRQASAHPSPTHA